MTMHDPLTVVRASTEITLWVPRGAAGDLAAGAMDVLADATPIASVEQLDVVGFRPTATDIRVDLVVDVCVHTVETDATSVETALTDGFGIITADVANVEQ